MDKLILTLKGRDDWDRPVYKSGGLLYVDVNPRKGFDPEICTKSGNQFYGEPDTPVYAEFEFIPARDTW